MVIMCTCAIVVTHNCIIGKIKLYHADGVEAVDR